MIRVRASLAVAVTILTALRSIARFSLLPRIVALHALSWEAAASRNAIHSLKRRRTRIQLHREASQEA